MRTCLLNSRLRFKRNCMKLFKGLLLSTCLLLSVTAAKSQAQIYINEILAGNTADSMDDFQDWDDWFELYFPPGQGQAVYNLADHYVSDDPLNLTKYQIQDDDESTIVSNQHKLFWADKDSIQGSLHVNFKFSSEGEGLYLTMPDGTTILDSISFGLQVDDISFGRECDGCPDWIFFNNTTPDEPNAEVVQEGEFLFINEVLSMNTSTAHDESNDNDPWIEIYNPNDYQINLAGYWLSNDVGVPLQYQIPNTNPYFSIIPANSFRLLWYDNEALQYTNHVPAALDTDGGDLVLTSPDGLTQTDAYSYPSGANNMSWGRQSDGSPTSINFTTPTPRVTNSLLIVEPENIYINEVMADNNLDTLDNHLEAEDWFEIYNPNNYDVDLGGYYISDNPESPMKWQVPVSNPDSTTVPANGWLLFWADEDGGAFDSQGVNHCSFKLKDSGEQLTVRSPDGFSIADEISWTFMPENQSFGRFVDGGSAWVDFLETTPEYSNNGSQVLVEEGISNSRPLTAYPNPVSGTQVNFSERVSGNLFTLSGQLVDQMSQEKWYNVSQLTPGIYIFQSTDSRILKIAVQ